jgi:uncharacterized protein (DUF2147 family)
MTDHFPHIPGATSRLDQAYRPVRGLRCLAATASVVLSVLANGGAVAQLSKTAPMATPGAAVTGTPGEPDVVGVWMDHTKRGAIEITPCGAQLCGYVYWVKDPVNRSGKAVVDGNNPDPARRGKPICGTQILANLSPQGRAKIGRVWGAGSIYNPEEGQNFDAELKLISANELSVLGYIGVKFLGEQFTWTRAPAELQRCGPARV